MVITSSKFVSIKPYFDDHIPKEMQVFFNKIKLIHYGELYEPDADETISLEDTLNEALELLRDSSNKKLSHLRYLWMTLILTLVVEPTLKYYQPRNLLPKNIINLISCMIANTISGSINLEKKINKNIIAKIMQAIAKNRNYYTEKELASFQILDEAMDVFDNAIRVLDYDQAIESILYILDDCLEGYAIFPGSQGRRKLFDWWLLEVLPASWNLQPPQSFYVLENLQNKEEIKLSQTRLMEKLSSEIWSNILKEIGYNQRPQSNTLSKPYIPVATSGNNRGVKINAGNDFKVSSNSQIINLSKNILSVCFV